jgi:hypothetical protein
VGTGTERLKLSWKMLRPWRWALYGVSAIPVFITIAAVGIMFVNSLQ